ncbi:MAG: aspartate dehydrogenase [Anaerolineae bacterium]|nr:aspartate dehydrogenase [Anaerolineae bacterium]
MRRSSSPRVGLIGFGAIGQRVAQALQRGEAGNAVLAAVLVRDIAKYAPRSGETVTELLAGQGVIFTDDPARFFASPLDLVVEAAGQDAVRTHAEPALRQGTDVLVVSIGAFTDDALYERLRDLAEKGDGRLLLAAGALPAVDWMNAAAMAPVSSVTITQTKPVSSWQGTPAEELVDLAGLSQPACFFTGTAREAAHTFAKSSNITAMLALSTVGMDATRVRLVADPGAGRMHTRIEFVGDAGEVTVEWRGTPSESNPSTSADVPLSVIKAIRNWAGDVVVGV